ncbi:MAG: hypothetical protein CM15mV1_2810 [uncultured marine virus]|jgi:hypothetical protein|nr:MAG: hypothetical protein CM15mV1_2810 [uncultured marine virus]|tara:strand:- start:104 stop:1033 length:930 start_codon:yes stop_codon:yes gene_type:complete
MNSVDIEKLADDIRSGNYKTEKIGLDQFFDVDPQGVISPIKEKRIQVREKDRDIDRVMRGVNKMEETGDKSGVEPLTIIKYSDNTYKIDNGNHTSEMLYRLGEKDADAFIVDFDTQLGSSHANCLTLGNLLNKQPIEKVDVHDADIKKELYEILNEELEKNGGNPLDDAKLKQIKDSVSGRYPHVKKATIGQWVNNHGVVGGRSKGTLITYSNGQLQSQQDYLQNMQRYKSYAILPPRTVRSYVDTGIAEAFRKMRDEGKYNCLVILYVDNVTQRDQWENGLEDKIIEEFDTLSEYWDCKIEYEMLRYD